MQKDNPKLNRVISELMSGEASPIPPDDEAAEKAIWSGAKSELDKKTYAFYATGNAGAPKMVADDWFIFSDEKSVSRPGILFWEEGGRYFARRLDEEQWGKFINAAKIKKMLW